MAVRRDRSAKQRRTASGMIQTKVAKDLPNVESHPGALCLPLVRAYAYFWRRSVRQVPKFARASRKRHLPTSPRESPQLACAHGLVFGFAFAALTAAGAEATRCGLQPWRWPVRPNEGVKSVLETLFWCSGRQGWAATCIAAPAPDPSRAKQGLHG